MRNLYRLSYGLPFWFSTAFFMLLSLSVNAQNCGENDLVFSSQADVDAFPATYPGCVTISGTVSISGSDITNLNGLAQITTIEGNLWISSASSLMNLGGLDALTSIGGQFSLYGNVALTSLSGLGALTSVERLDLGNNDALTNLSGLDALAFIARNLSIEGNAALTSLTGLEGLIAIGNGLSIQDNPLLAVCEIQGVCNYLAIPANNANIVGNAAGCGDAAEIQTACGLPLPVSCPGHLWFTTQAEIDSFPLNYPGCTSILGSVTITGSDITNLEGLTQIAYISEDLNIGGADSLTNLAGLNGLISVGSYFFINNNDLLTNLSGLEKLTTVGGGLWISENPALTSLSGLSELSFVRELHLYGNEGLNSLSGLEALVIIETELNIGNNSVLASLSGLEGLIAIGGLAIENNPALSFCAIQSICDYLAIPDNNALIYGNAADCAGVAQVQIACGLPVTCPGNISFLRQAEIDSFPLIYSNCTTITGSVIIAGSDISNLTGLSEIKSIEGSLQIYENDALTDLSGLDSLSFIGEDLYIGNNPALTSLTGLEGITSIERFLNVDDNPALTSLGGLEGLTSVGIFLTIGNNRALTSLTGLNNLTSVGRSLHIYGSDALTNLSGLEALVFTGGLDISYNAALSNFSGLESLTSIGSRLLIENNSVLSSISELESLNSIGDLKIENNPALSICHQQSICDYLADAANQASIFGNAPGCASVAQVQTACGLPVTCPGNIAFLTQADVDSFPIIYPGCTTISGHVSIIGSNIKNLNGLAQITTIAGGLNIRWTDSLTNLTGLNALNSVGEDLNITENTSLNSLTGLEALASVGFGCIIEFNDALTNLSGLNSLTTVEYLYISYNASLISLTGLEALTAIGEMNIVMNPVLSICNIQSICDYLNIPTNSAVIFGNASGCASRAEVEAACEALIVSPIVNLQGPYDIDAGLMRDALRANALLPLREPFTALGYIHVGGGGENTSQTVFDLSGANAIVDWVFLELRDKTDFSITKATRSALLQRDGDVVDVDGRSPVFFSNLPADEYYLVVKHRNHLGVMSAAPVAISRALSVVDLTSDLNNVFGGVNGVARLGDGLLGLFSGDFNHSGQIQNTDFNFMIPTLGVPAGYLPGDHDLNGQVQNTDLQLKLIPNIGRGQPFGQ